MSEARIAVKVVRGRFVTVYPMVEPKPDEVTFPQHPQSSRTEQVARHRRVPHEQLGLAEYVQTKEDQA